MIAYLSGKTIHKDLKYAVVHTSSGVGYKVHVTTDTLSKMTLGEPVDLYIHTVVREDALDLYAFKDRDTLEFFELLITISGIGPKSAIGILSATSVSSLKEAVFSGETAYLTKISGIGKKVADKIVLELKGKVGAIEEGSRTQNGDIDAIEALQALGYSQKEARDALEKVGREVADTGEKVKSALRLLGK